MIQLVPAGTPELNVDGRQGPAGAALMAALLVLVGERRRQR
ncbi:MAG TPA: hypothetical protein VGO93_03790 [Candidatus Xenobia bacterium]